MEGSPAAAKGPAKAMIYGPFSFDLRTFCFLKKKLMAGCPTPHVINTPLTVGVMMQSV